MAKKRPASKGRRSQGQSQSAEALQAQLQRLVARHKYRQALNVLKTIRHQHPELTVRPSEGEILLLRGQQELASKNPHQAATSIRQALELGIRGEGYYWLAKCLLADERPEEALEVVGTAFEQRKLSKDYAGCYLKLLFLNGNSAKVRQLLAEQPKRFAAAQLHWARGMLALHEGNHEDALAHFKKMKRDATPGDSPLSWIAYTQQQMQDWDTAAMSLGMTTSFFPPRRFGLNRDVPVLERLKMLQAASTNQSLLEVVDLQNDPTIPKREAAIVADIVNLVEAGEMQPAAIALGELKLPSTQFPQLFDLQRPLYLLAGQQALQEGYLDEAETLWGSIVKQSPFDPQLAVNLHAVLWANDSFSANERLLRQLQKWLETEAKQHPQDWPERRLNSTLAQLNCLQSDNWWAMGRSRNAIKALQQAEQLCPDSPDVIGRQGLQIKGEGKLEKATTLLTQALEKGCRHHEVYTGLLDCWKELDNRQELREARRRFGRHFGDLGAEYEIELPTWEEALSTRNYPLFEHRILDRPSQEAPDRACVKFIDAVVERAGGDRVEINLKAASQDWDDLLQTLEPEAKISTFEAIFLCLQLLTKRKKGLAALQNRYLDRLGELAERLPEAEHHYLAMASIRGTRLPQLEKRLRRYLKSHPQPHNALAEIQLLVRRFCNTGTLRPFLSEALQMDGENPLLLLSQATTYAVNSQPYTELKERGFELARRLQDARALAAFREETFLQSLTSAKQLLPGFGAFESGGLPSLIEQMLRRMAEEIIGRKLSQEEFEAILPELEKAMPMGPPDFEDEDMLDFFGDSDDEEFPDFGRPRSRGKSKQSKRSRHRKKGFDFPFF